MEDLARSPSPVIPCHFQEPEHFILYSLAALQTFLYYFSNNTIYNSDNCSRKILQKKKHAAFFPTEVLLPMARISEEHLWCAWITRMEFLNTLFIISLGRMKGGILAFISNISDIHLF